MKNAEFEAQYKRLNAKQKEAVDTIEGPVMVIAGPGTGKTTVLTLRIANIIKNDTQPDAILALTFTESGVSAMRDKLSTVIGPSAYRVHIHTFHSFANDIIKTYPDRFPRLIGSEHMEELEQIRLMQEVLDTADIAKLRPKNDPTYYVSPCLSAIKDLKRENISPEAFGKLVKKQETELAGVPDMRYKSGRYTGEVKGKYRLRAEKLKKNRELVGVYRLYEEKLGKARLYDYEDMIMECVRVLESDANLLLKLQEDFQYILADEHQDANNAQNRLLELLSSFHKDPNLFIVGDEKQAIFRFQGASLENFLYFRRLFPSARLVTLEENYRSNQTILDAAHSLIVHNPISDESLRVSLISRAVHKPEKISVATLADRSAERAFVAEEISKRLKAGESLSEIAVLVRENKDAEPMERVLRDHGIGVARFADADALSHVRIDAFLKLLEASVEPSDERLAPILFLDFLGLDPHDVYMLLEARHHKRASLVRLLRESKPFKKFTTDLSRWAKIARNESLVEGFGRIARESGYSGHLIAQPGGHELLPLYGALLRSVERYAEREKRATVANFVTYLARAREHDISINAEVSAPEGVSVMTAHRSKGLEFNSVFILHAEDGVWGGRRSRSLFDLTILGGEEDHETEDERRLFYVAITRARKEAVISYFQRDDDGRERVPSRFIAEIAEAHRLHLTPSIPTSVHKQTSLSSPLLSDSAYLRALFFKRGLSVTHLNNFLECPWRYFFVDLIRVPESQSPALLYGSAIHAALKSYFDAYAREEDITIAQTLHLFEQYIRRTHLSQRDFESHAAEGKRELKRYLGQGNFPRAIYNEFRIGGIPLALGKKKHVTLNGSLDKVELLSGNEINVVDYKTGRPKSRAQIEGTTNSSNGDYKRQLIFYKLLVDVEGKWRMKTGTLDFIKPDERGRYRREVFTIEDTEVKALRALTADVARQIADFSFADQGCGKRDCEWCTLKEASGSLLA